MSVLNKRIEIKKPKSDINLINKPSSVKNILPVLFVGLTIIGLVVVLFVFDALPDYRHLLSLESEYKDKQNELNMREASNSNYEKTRIEYLQYCEDCLSAEEKNYADRNLILEKIDKYLISNGAVMRIRLSENTLVTSLYDVSMGAASQVIRAMLDDEDGLIEYAATTSADNDLMSEKQRIPTIEMKIEFTKN